MEMLLNNLRNIPGWKTSRRIVVFESDDWGSIRMPSKDVYNILLSKGIAVDSSYYSINDSLESNYDLEGLFSVLKKHKDFKGNHPVFTALTIVANPDFTKILSDNFKSYYYESTEQSAIRYGASHNNIYRLWRQGINDKVFYPEFHGREHLNIKRWMSLLRKSKSVTKYCFDHDFIGLGEEYGISYLPAYDIDTNKDLIDQKNILSDGINLFFDLFQYKPNFFVPPNSLISTRLEPFLKDLGISVLSGARWQKEPLGSNKFKRNIRYTGKLNNFEQIYINRNVQFEHGHNAKEYGWQKAIKDIETAFFWKNPAIISTHRVNYLGFINENNRKNGLVQLDNLLKNILKKWPDVEFMTSYQLSQLIKESKS